MRVIDLFCGAGGFSEGFRQAGFDVIWAVDKWRPAVTTHNNNHPTCDAILDDVSRIAFLPDDEFERIVPDSEVIIGSPPCVDFSNSNKSGKSDKSLGIRLIEAYLRIVARKKFKKNSLLKYWILENVPNAEPFVKEEYSAKDLGLDGDLKLRMKFLSSHFYNSQYFGVPSKRKRFICGNFPEPESTILFENNLVPLKHVLNCLGSPTDCRERIIHDPNYDYSMQSQQLTDHFYIQEVAEFEWKKAKRLKQDKGYMGKMSLPENVNKPARTIMATMSFSARESMILGYEDGRYRAPTIREVACLMSFPISYRFYGDSVYIKYTLVGNAIPPKLAFAFAKAIAEKERANYQINHSLLESDQDDPDFVNLNGAIIPVRKERTKRDVSRFKYHIPYLKVKTFRVELSNHSSDFAMKRFQWEVKIHKGQGPKAEVFIPAYSERWLPNEILPKVKLFIEEKIAEIGSARKLQENFCQTDVERETQNLIGPIELLTDIKSFLGSLQINQTDDILIQKDVSSVKIPIIIAIGYFVLSEIVTQINRR